MNQSNFFLKVIFLLLFGIIFFGVINVNAASIFYYDDGVVTNEMETIFTSIENDDSIITFDTSYVYDRESGSYIYQLKELVFSKEDNKLIKTINLYSGNDYLHFKDIDVVKINKDYAIVAFNLGVIKISLNDGAVVKTNYSKGASRIKKINDDYVVYSSDSAYIIDENLNIKYTLDDYEIFDIAVDNSLIYLLYPNSSYEEDTERYYYNLYIFNEKFEKLREKRYFFDADDQSINFATGSITNFMVYEDRIFFTSHYINEFKNDGSIVKLKGDFYPNENGIDYSTMKEINGYLVSVGYEVNNGITSAFIEIFDKNLISLQKINVNEEQNRVINDGLSVVKNIYETEDGFIATGVFRDVTNNIEEGFALVYHLFHNIYLKTDGNGSVFSSKVSSPSGELISFRIVPNEGYILDSVKVTDASGNVVTFTSNTFTMPSEDVTIEAIFRKIVNPVTETNIIVIAFVVMIVIVCTIIVYIKRSKEEML